MPIFTRTGDTAKDFWLVDGEKDFGVFPGGIVEGVDEDLPIWLKVGNKAFGQVHIHEKHSHWIAGLKKTVPELLYEKLGQAGVIYSTEEVSKIKVNLRLTPSALLVIQLMDRAYIQHFSVTSLYLKSGHLDGEILGRYPPRPPNAKPEEDR